MSEKLKKGRDLSSLVKIGYTVSSCGLKGEIKIQMLFDLDFSILKDCDLIIGEKPYKLKDIKRKKDLNYTIKLHDINSIDDAINLMRKNICCVRKNLGNSKESEFIPTDLIGLDVFKYDSTLKLESCTGIKSFEKNIIIGYIENIYRGINCCNVSVKCENLAYKSNFKKIKYPVNEFWFPHVYPDIGVCFIKVMDIEVV